ncbi:MAG: efflux RND transporter periplasmic adaptor subunit [Deltaproteobacteria bacterium]|nr:efflux RND transporter periplasmic adaptor subunit [Deltaproteobacteria bacterium]
MADDQLSRDLASLKIDRSAPPKRRGALIMTLLVLAGLGAVGYFVVYPRVHSALSTPSVKTATVQLVSPSQASIQLTATGYVVAQVSAKVAAKVPGRIATIEVVEGQEIKKGQKVATLENVDHRSAIATAQARASAARARVQIARSNVVELKDKISRDKPLADRGVISSEGVRDMQARIGSLDAAVVAAQAEVNAADAEARSLQVQLGSYEIVSPIDGTVVKKLVEVGEGVSPGFGTPGVIEVVDMSSLVVEVDVPEARLEQVGDPKKDPKACEIVLDAYASKRFLGHVLEIGRRVNRAKATVPVKIAFDERPPEVLPEMAARVSFLDKKMDKAQMQEAPKLVVPASAVTKRNGADVLFLLDDDRVRMRTIKVGGDVNGSKILETEIPTGTKVVLDPPADLIDGAKVKESK